MRFLDLLKLVFDNLNRRKGRVALTAIGVVIGTASVVLLISLASGLQRSATENLWGISDLKRIDVYPGWIEGGGGGMMVEKAIVGGGGGKMEPSMVLLTPKTVDDIRAIPGVELVTPSQSLSGQATLRYGRMENYPWLQGVNVEDVGVFEYPLAAGTSTLERGTAVMGGWVAKQWFDPKLRPGQEPPEQPDVVGQVVKLVLTKWSMEGIPVNKTVNLKIVGVFAEARGQQDSILYVNWDDLVAWEEWMRGTRVNFSRDGYNQLIVRAESPEMVVDIANQINEMGYQANTPQTYVEGINSFFVILQIVFGAIGALSLLVAAIGIANTMAMAILERTREIGLMKAIGATNRDVLSIFLGEAAGIGLIGGIGGVILGWGGSLVISDVSATFLSGQANPYGMGGVAAYTPPWLPLFALAFATLIGLLSGLYPSLRAATLVPVNALKYE
jgi:putative ABC transport system permease protein